MLLTYLISEDDRLIRKAMHDFHTSLRPDGLISMHYPAQSNVVLPAFSLFFPLMVYDHILYGGDQAVAKMYFPTVDTILNYYDRQITASGLVGQFSPGYWSYVDWVDGWSFGTPPAARFGPGTYFRLVYAVSLRVSAKIAEYIAQRSTASEYLERQRAVIAAVNTHCFDGTWYYDGLITDKSNPPPHWRSQHCQVYAIIAGALSDTEAERLMRRTLQDKTLPRMSLAQSFYLLSALEITNLYDLVEPLWEPCKNVISQNLDTWPEEEINPRTS